MNESYVERWTREQKEAAQKEQKKQKAPRRKPQKEKVAQKEVENDGTDTRSEGHEAQAESSGGDETI